MKILYSRTSFKYLETLDQKTKIRIIKAIDKLPDQGDVVRLQAKKIKNIFRLRVGKFRIIFVIEENCLRILDIDSRGDIYK